MRTGKRLICVKDMIGEDDIDFIKGVGYVIEDVEDDGTIYVESSQGSCVSFESVSELHEYFASKEDKFPPNIMAKLRMRRGLESNDTSQDHLIEHMDADTAFEEVCHWEGLIGYAETIKSWIRDIYGMEVE